MGTILVTGAAGFIGFHLCQRLLAQHGDVVGIDNLNAYYDVRLKHARLQQLEGRPGFRFQQIDVADRPAVERLFRDAQPEYVLHMAAQAGVRYAAENPHVYADSNLVGFLNMLEGCRHSRPKHLVYASSSSVYGANTRVPFSESHGAGHPVSLYAATKRANELMAHSYCHLYGLPTTGLRFFTVYGPWGRPDMALFKFTRAILCGEPIDVYNEGRMRRDFTYVDDVVEATLRLLPRPAAPDANWRSDDPNPSTSCAPYRVYNIGNHAPVPLLEFIETLEQCLGRTAVKRLLPAQPGDVVETYADDQTLARDIDFSPATPLRDGIARFVDWYRTHYVSAGEVS
ncbi:MAG: NAD-dependent epimerase [Pirellulales bacterium]